MFRPGVGFFEDYDRFYRRRHQGELQWAFHEDRRQISEPLKVAYLFTEKRTGRPANSITFVPSKDVETAKLILATLGFEEVPLFLDYALTEAKNTNFDIQTLGGGQKHQLRYPDAWRHQTISRELFCFEGAQGCRPGTADRSEGARPR